MAKTQKQPQSPWVDEQGEKKCDTHTEIPLTHKKETLLSVTPMELKGIMLCEVSLRQILYDPTYMWNLKKLSS